jgi:hypothetical protein
MAATQTSAQAASETRSAVKHTGESRANPARREATDDEILGIGQATEAAGASSSGGLKMASAGREREGESDSTAGQGIREEAAEPENLRTALDSNPELRQAWQDARAYRETFATPEEARAATALLADLDHMDSLFFSQRPEDHVTLARAVASLDPAAFASLAKAMNGLATETQRHAENPTEAKGTEQGRVNNENANAVASTPSTGDGLGRNSATAAQETFFHATNAAAVQSVLDAIESQVERLLPESASKSARNRVVGEIYRELDNTLRSNRELAQQMREAFRSGALDADHQRAIVSLISGRARQALPGVAKRVLNEWTSTVVAANQDRRARQRAAERRVDIAGSNGAGNDGRRPTTPRDIDYARMSDADILNM